VERWPAHLALPGSHRQELRASCCRRHRSLRKLAWVWAVVKETRELTVALLAAVSLLTSVPSLATAVATLGLAVPALLASIAALLLLAVTSAATTVAALAYGCISTWVCAMLNQ
jgi:hypothetical protein